MTLKTDYFDGATGFHSQMNDVFDAGVAWISTNLATISTDLQTAAAAGKTSFSLSYPASPASDANLALEGTYMNAFLAGILSGFADQDIYSYEVSASVDDSSTPYNITLSFTF